MREISLMLGLLGSIGLFAAGCVSESPVSLVSNKTLAISRINAATMNSKGPVMAEDCLSIIGFVPTSGPPVLDEAVDRALQAKNANLLVNGKVTFHYFYIPYIYGQYCWKAEGEAYEVRE